MTSISWNAEGGTNGVTITSGNSGGASGTAWDTVSIVANGTAVYDSSNPLTGTMSARVATGVTSGAVFLQWGAALQALWPGGMTTNYGRAYLKYAALPSANRIVIQFVDTTLATNRGHFLLLTTGALRLRNAASGTVATFTATLSVDTTYRLEWRVDGSTTGAYRMDLFAGNNTSPIESIVGGTANFGGTIGGAAFGYLTNGASIANQWIDSVQLNDTGLPGPASTNYNQSAAASSTVAATVTKNVGKAAAASCTVTASVATTVQRVQDARASVTGTPAVRVNVGHNQAATVTTTAAVTTTIQRVQAATASVTVTAPVRMAVGKAVLAPVTVTPTIARSLSLAQLAVVTTAVRVRAQAPARLIVLAVGQPLTRWVVGDPITGLFTVAAPITRWRVGRPLVQQYASSSLEYVPVPISAMVNGLPYDPTGDDVYMLFSAAYAAPTAGSSGWKTATWTTGSPTGTYLANCLIGPGGTVELDPGTYQVWIKITDDPEVPVRYSGQIEVLP